MKRLAERVSIMEAQIAQHSELILRQYLFIEGQTRVLEQMNQKQKQIERALEIDQPDYQELEASSGDETLLESVDSDSLPLKACQNVILSL